MGREGADSRAAASRVSGLQARGLGGRLGYGLGRAWRRRDRCGTFTGAVQLGKPPTPPPEDTNHRSYRQDAAAGKCC